MSHMWRALLRSAVAVTLCMTILRSASAQCVDRNRLSADQKLETLERSLNRTDRTAVACAVVYMDELSRRGDARVIPVLIRNLDLHLTFSEMSSLRPHACICTGDNILRWMISPGSRKTLWARCWTQLLKRSQDECSVEMPCEHFWHSKPTIHRPVLQL
jgi:hypothetical protein